MKKHYINEQTYYPPHKLPSAMHAIGVKKAEES